MTNSKRIIEACGICTTGNGVLATDEYGRPLCAPSDCANCTQFDAAWATVMEKLRYGA